ncbi:hypothetical protein BGZ59_006999 [Podila verticillata]|nr:hypothetical protein BGZ59_006999 [Podila verticillata]
MRLYSSQDDIRLKAMLESITSESSTVSLWDYLKEELTAADFETTQELKRERVANFLSVPIAFEKMLVFGYFVCLDSFLYNFTILPARFVLATIALFRRLKSSQKCDLIKVALVVVACTILQSVDASRTYHFIRGQNAMKLYAIFNCLEIFDRLCCSFGQDILDSLFSKSTLGSHPPTASRHARPLTFVVLAVLYILAHTLVLFFQMVTLNVAVNSYSNALLTLLISNQFVEIKGSVFKKFEKENLFQLSCSDWLKHAFITKFNQIRPSVYGRFVDILSRDLVVGSPARLAGNKHQQMFVDQSPMVSRRIGLAALPLACLVICVTIQTLQMVLSTLPSEPGRVLEVETAASVLFDPWAFQWPTIDTSGFSVAMSSIVELLVQLCKVGWIVLGQGWAVNSRMLLMWIHRGISPTLVRHVVDIAMICLTCIATYACLVALKLLIGINLLGFAHHRYTTMESREQVERQTDRQMRESNAAQEEKAASGVVSGMLDGRMGHPNGDSFGAGGEKRTLAGLDTIERYSLYKSRIP